MTRPYALTVRAPASKGYEIADALGFDALTEALAVSVFDAEPGQVTVQALYETRAQAEMAQASLPGDTISAIEELPDQDWVGLSQSGLPPIRAGRFAVHGSHDAPPDGADFPILVDAGQAFGTGHHGTTQGCLLMLDAIATHGASPRTVLDLGTGAGILAIAAAKLFPDADVLATDIDPIAVEVAKANASPNGVAFRTVVADGFDAPVLRDRTFDLVIANILAAPLRGLAAEIAAATEPSGQIVLSGILDEQAEWVAEAFRDAGLSVESQPSLDGWTSLRATRP
ncbi:MAG: 50S ribosomal protein L11 methyltransferase [Litorimonas sp.]